ncbi:MAG TPA: HAMP domain-containing sensor histidine kinase [Actinomycetota bacterium]|nr:HAMP domain-containing sensor histidine kinase [Actinomycetota bacterium]
MRSLRGRAVVALATVSIVILSIYLIAVFLIFRDQLRRTTDRQLVSYSATVIDAVAGGSELPPPPLDAGQVGAIVIDAGGRVVDITTNFEFELTEQGESSGDEGSENGGEGGGDDASNGGSVLNVLVHRATGAGTFLDLKGEHGTPLRAWTRIATINGSPWVVATVAPASAASGPASQLLLVSALTLAAVIALSGGVASWTGGVVVRPLERLARDVHDLDENDPTARVDVPAGTREVQAVANAVNSMLGRIDAALQHEKSFLADASHELRNPLAALRGELELALRDADPDRLRGGIVGAIEEVDRLSRLSDDILLLARLDVSSEVDLTPVSLRDVAMQTIVDHARQADARKIGLTVDGDDQVVRATERLAQRAVANLVDNAIRHAPEGSAVELTLWQNGTVAGIDVTDRGPGIPSADRERIFGRFARADRGRSRAAGGTGLGLAITRDIMRALGGSVTLESAEPGRTTFRVSFATV